MPSVVQVLAAMKIAASGGCTTVVEQNTSAIADVDFIGFDASDFYIGQFTYTPLANYSVCGIEWVLTATGTISGNTYTCEVYNDLGTSLGTVVGVSAGITGVNGWSQTSVKFLFSPTISLTTLGQYAIVITKNAAPDSSNYARASLSSAGGFTGFSASYNSAGVRQTFSTEDYKLTIYTP